MWGSSTFPCAWRTKRYGIQYRVHILNWDSRAHRVFPGTVPSLLLRHRDRNLSVSVVVGGELASSVSQLPIGTAEASSRNMAVLSFTEPGLPQMTSCGPGLNSDGPCEAGCQVLKIISVTLNLAELQNKNRNRTSLAKWSKYRPSNSSSPTWPFC